MKVDFHIHTSFCGHATGSMEEYVDAAVRNGCSAIGFADHLPMLFRDDRSLSMAAGDLPSYVESVLDLQKRYKDDLSILLGIEADYHPPTLDKCVEMLNGYPFDFVIGSRILGKAEKSSRLRFLGLHIFSFIISVLLGKKITDCTSGFRAFRANLVDKIMLQEDQFHTSELIIDAVKKGFRIGEAPVTISKRKHGSSKKGKDWKYGLNFAKVIIKSWWR